VVTQTIASEGSGRWGEYVGGYSDWLRQRSLPRATYAAPRGVAATVAAAPALPKRKLSFKEQRELDSLPGEIEKLEAEQQALTLRICEPDYHRVGADQMRRDRERASELVSLIAQRMERWETLEALASRVAGA